MFIYFTPFPQINKNQKKEGGEVVSIETSRSPLLARYVASFSGQSNVPVTKVTCRQPHKVSVGAHVSSSWRQQQLPEKVAQLSTCACIAHWSGSFSAAYAIFLKKNVALAHRLPLFLHGGSRRAGSGQIYHGLFLRIGTSLLLVKEKITLTTTHHLCELKKYNSLFLGRLTRPKTKSSRCLPSY